MRMAVAGMDHRPACTLAGNYPIQLRPVGTAKACRHSREDQTCTSVAGVDHRLACRVVVAQGRQQMCTAVAGMDHRPACTLKGSRSSPISSRGRTKVDSRRAQRWQEWIIGRRAHSKVPGALRSRVEVERRPHALDAHLCRTSSSASLSGRISVPFGGMSQPEGAASVWCSPAAS